MKFQYPGVFLNALSLTTILLIGCKNSSGVSQTLISIASFNKATLDTGRMFTHLKILRIYPSLVECNVKEKYANLYICKKLMNSDTIYLFEECKMVPNFAYDTSDSHVVIVDKDDVQVHCPSTVTVFVPVDFKMRSDAKYLFAKISDLTEF